MLAGHIVIGSFRLKAQPICEDRFVDHADLVFVIAKQDPDANLESVRIAQGGGLRHDRFGVVCRKHGSIS